MFTAILEGTKNACKHARRFTKKCMDLISVPHLMGLQLCISAQTHKTSMHKCTSTQDTENVRAQTHKTSMLLLLFTAHLRGHDSQCLRGGEGGCDDLAKADGIVAGQALATHTLDHV